MFKISSKGYCPNLDQHKENDDTNFEPYLKT